MDSPLRPVEQLAPYASTEANSRGRRFAEPPPQHRSEYQRDRDRIIHCNAFRRLVYKTQVFVNHEGDLFRTRLTHSMEVAQIARSIARVLNINETLTEAICLAHDLGHTPFGHAGQDALNACMRPYGGFEHNLQSLRVVDELEDRYADFRGLNLTFECREGILKHCSVKHARQLGDLGLRFIRRRQPSLEAQLANVADEIAYNNHDVDDGLRAGIITLDDLSRVTVFDRQYREVVALHPGIPERKAIHETTRRVINFVVGDLIAETRANIAKARPQCADDIKGRTRPLVAFSAQVRKEALELKQFLHEHLYRHYKVLRMNAKARDGVTRLFETFMADPRLLPPEHQQIIRRMQRESGESGKARAVADYIAGMTDRFAILEQQRLFDPSQKT